MKVLIQNTKTAAFVNPDGWTAELQEAGDFQSSLRAMAYAVQHGLKEACVLYHFSMEHDLDFRIPIPKGINVGFN